MERCEIPRGGPGIGRLIVALGLAALVGGCFQPLYGEQSPSGGPAVREALAGVVVEQINALPSTIDARLATQIRNELIFNFTGGGSPAASTHRQRVQVSGSRGTVSVGADGLIPHIENFALSATYSMVEIASGRVVATGRLTTYASYDPAGTQRFARLGGLQDAGQRTAKTVADSITTRLASYFVSGQ